MRGGRAEAPVPRSDVSFRLDQQTGNSNAVTPCRVMQWSVLTEGKANISACHMKNNENNGGAEWSGGQIRIASHVDGISISNHMAKYRNAVSVCCRLQNVSSACNAGGSSSLHTRMIAAARLMQLLRCAATHLKTSQRFLQHASNTQRTHALAR